MKVALIPARCGSERIRHKNIKPLSGHPLIAYAIRAAIDSHCFDQVWVSSDSRDYLSIAESYGALTIVRQFKHAETLSPDIDWVNQILDHIDKFHGGCDIFSILRPTSPFRTSDTIKRAMNLFDSCQPCDSIRAVQLCKEHPAKMWKHVEKENDRRIIPFYGIDHNFHNQPYQSLSKLYIQNASLEIAWTDTVRKFGTVSGIDVKPFHTKDFEGFDINTPEDWIIAELLIKENIAKLQEVKIVE